MFNFLLGVLIGTVFGAVIKTYAGHVFNWIKNYSMKAGGQK